MVDTQENEKKKIVKQNLIVNSQDNKYISPKAE